MHLHAGSSSSGSVTRDSVDWSRDESLFGIIFGILENLSPNKNDKEGASVQALSAEAYDGHLTMQHRHGSLNWKMITRPEEVSPMRCDTVAPRKIVSSEDQN